MCHSVFAAEKHNYIDGSIGGEVWYADWESENQWTKEGVNLDYDIKPSIIYGYSASLNYTKNNQRISSFVLEHFTSRMEKEINSQAFEGDEDDRDTYRKIKVKIDQRIGEGTYFHLQVMHAKFEGEITVRQGGQALQVPTGTIWQVNTRWFKADAMYLSEKGETLAGFGFRYISYSKPETTSLFAATGSTEGLMTEGDLLSGEVIETEFDGYYLSCGIFDKSYIGIPTDSAFFLDLLFYFGVSYAKNDIIGKNSGIGGGVEGALDIKYSYKFSEASGITARLGYRVLYKKMGTSEEVATDNQGNEIFRVTETIDTWHGPFFGLIWFF